MWSLCCDVCLAQTPAREPLSTEQRQHFETALAELKQSLAALPVGARRVADAAIYAKGLEWALKYEREFSPADVALMERAIELGQVRVAAIAAGKVDWNNRPGRMALGFTSSVDGSVQPYGVVLPKNFDPTRQYEHRLDVVLHGSMQPTGLSELKFMSRFDAKDQPEPVDAPFIEIHPLGRVENCYRWAGETDVFEAIDAAGRFEFHSHKVVLRGMSMGASGTWHLGLKHPDSFVALGPYCGYVDTHRFSETPLPNFVKVGPLPEHQELGLHMLDSVDYAANASMVPAIACMGEKDIFFDAHVIMAAAMRQEGIQMVNLISPGTGHEIDPITHAEQMRLIKPFADRGRRHVPREVRFVTWTLKYNRCSWVSLLGLDQHYQRAEIVAKIEGGRILVTTIKNINRFEIYTGEFKTKPSRLEIGGQSIDVPPYDSSVHRNVFHTFARVQDRWELAASNEPGRHGAVDKSLKRPRLQGPIDDAFTSPFLCVQGTGEPWNVAADDYAKASLQRFASEWHRYFRGELPIKKDTEVTEEDVKNKNLILFGDPGSNSWIAKIQDKLPIAWTRESIQVGSQKCTASEHVPALIMPNPLLGAEEHYVVLNSGHTFHASELGKVNYLLFPRWGDWAVLKFDAEKAKEGQASEEAVQAGFFNEQWQLPTLP